MSLSVSKEALEQKRSIVASLYSELDNLKRQLRLQQKLLASMKKPETSEHTASDRAALTPRNAVGAVARYARKKGVIAARALRDGKGDPGYVRDLADAAVFGSSLAALALADITLRAKVADQTKQLTEAHAWLSLAALLQPDDAVLKTRERDLAEKLTPEQSAASRLLLGEMEERRALLLTNPYD